MSRGLFYDEVIKEVHRMDSLAIAVEIYRENGLKTEELERSLTRSIDTLKYIYHEYLMAMHGPIKN